MKIINLLPHLLTTLQRWETPPDADRFEREYVDPIRVWLKPMLDDFKEYRGTTMGDWIATIDWPTYRQHALAIDPAHHESRVRARITEVEQLLGLTLNGEAVLFGAFLMMDGYARFEGGSHRVFLGMDDQYEHAGCQEILITHELTHVARESIGEVWSGYGLDPKMDHDEFVARMPVLEHLANEGFACTVSELIHPGHSPWNYTYQDRPGYEQLHGIAGDVNRTIREVVANGVYRELYDPTRYGTTPPAPMFTQYAWAWKWTKHVLATRFGGDARKMVGACSKDWAADALAFEI